MNTVKVEVDFTRDPPEAAVVGESIQERGDVAK